MTLPFTPRHQRFGWLLAGAMAAFVSLPSATALGQQPPPPATAAPPPTSAQQQRQPPPGYQQQQQPPPGYYQQQQPPPGYYQQQQPPPGYYQQAPPGYYPPPGYYQQPVDEYDRRRQEALMKEDWPMKSPGMVIGGSILTAAGGIGVIAGTILLSVNSTTCVFGSAGSSCTKSADKTTAGIVVLLVSGASLAVGIPLIVVGRKKVPPKPEPVASVHVGPQGGAFSLQF